MLFCKFEVNFLIVFILLSSIGHGETIILNGTVSNGSGGSSIPSKVVALTSIDEIEGSIDYRQILKMLGVPGYSWSHGYNYVALGSWSCEGGAGSVLRLWMQPTKYVGTVLGVSDVESRAALKALYRKAGIAILVNAFSSFYNPVSGGNFSASECADRLYSFVRSYDLDGVNIDFRDNVASKEGKSLKWLTQFFLAFGRHQNFTAFLTLEVSFYDLSLYPTSDMAALEKTVGWFIDYYVVRYYSTSNQFKGYYDVFQKGKLSVEQLSKRGLPLRKIVVGKPSIFVQSGFVHGRELIEWAKTAHKILGWRTGAAVFPFIEQQAGDLMKQLIIRRDTLDPVAGTNLDSINFWWPPEKTVGDIGVPSYAPNNIYNYFIFGTWTCKNGAFDIAKLWSAASFYLSTKFGSSTDEIQAFLKKKYQAAGKKIVVRAFGSGESPTSARLDPEICGRALAEFVLANNLDGVDVHYRDNMAFNAGTAEAWLSAFTKALRNGLPFHLISHTIEDLYLSKGKYSGGSYEKVIKDVGGLIDFYPIVYYGEQHTNYNTYEELFVNSGTEVPQSSVLELVSRGFELNKIVVAKPVRLYDAQGAGFVEAPGLRQIFLEASKKLGWRAGACYSSFINDQDGSNILLLLRGMNRTDTIRLSYINNAKTWPPKEALAQMGVPTYARPNIYNYFAYSFWTFKAPKDVTTIYNDPIHYFGTELGDNKTAVQAMIKKSCADAKTKLLVSAFGDSQFPAKQKIDPILCANKFIDYVASNEMDGVDIDFEDNESFANQTGEYWLIVFTQQLRRALPFYIISHAPQAPYFSPGYAPRGGYLTVNNVVGKFIDFYNIQFYNQGNTTYSTYDLLFIDSGSLNPQTAIYQLIAQGVAPEKIVLGKPVTQADAYNTGFVSSGELNLMLKKSKADTNNPGWRASVMYWNFLSDLDGKAIKQSLNGL